MSEGAKHRVVWKVTGHALLRPVSKDHCMKVRKHQLLDNALPDHVLNEPLNPRHVLQHMLIRLTDLALDVNVRKEPLSDRKRFLVPLPILSHDRVF